MISRSRLTQTTSPQFQPARKLRRLANLALSQRLLYRRKRHNYTGKELDSETGLYYYGARYLDPKASRWLSGDPAVGEYFPSAPINDEARKRNESLPGMGGVFNYVNLHVYHYAGNNPVKYTDPDGESDVSIEMLPRAVPFIYSVSVAIIGNLFLALTLLLPLFITSDISNSASKAQATMMESDSTIEENKERAKDRRERERAEANEARHGESTWEEAVSGDYVRWQGEQKEKRDGKDGRRESHDLKQRGEPDRTKTQIREDYE